MHSIHDRAICILIMFCSLIFFFFLFRERKIYIRLQFVRQWNFCSSIKSRAWRMNMRQSGDEHKTWSDRLQETAFSKIFIAKEIWKTESVIVMIKKQSFNFTKPISRRIICMKKVLCKIQSSNVRFVCNRTHKHLT